ncbi:succinoglycan biosynthesis transport protein ExoP [Rhodovulum bhavnagarense]|uniref:non-specific protein-tyrosine kinase n=1 Tax=Rhodovulum bhavnagarense TaxID=992286 RepID=A0A4V2SVG5_9RHOB|nr:AAA family ATPase [Rhodovulum bhavnagarense]TCP58386.1 succinoglycan biosynthesis transport protein ExoP [Rhodovulum bhavnagarense]
MTILGSEGRAPRSVDANTTQPYGDSPPDEIDVSKLFAVVRRRWRVLSIGVIVGLALGLAYVATTTKIYQSAVSISLDTVEAANLRELSGVQSVPLTESQVTTELEIIRSEAIAEQVVARLALQDNAVFMTRPQTGVSRLKRLAGKLLSGSAEWILPQSSDIPPLPPSAEDQEAARRERAVSILLGNMGVKRLRDSRIVSISYSALSPDLAARVANAIAEVYITDQLESKYDSTERATSWLKQRSDQLREELAQLDAEIERYKLANGLVSVSGTDTSDSELARLATQLSQAQTILVSLEAKQRRLQEIVERGDTSAAVSATATQAITSELRSRFLDTLKDYNSLVSRLGAEHEQSLRLKGELDQIQFLMFEEIKRSERITRNDIALAEEEVRRLRFAKAKKEEELGAGSEAIRKLRELERNAETVRGLYTNFLQRYQQSLQEQSFAVSDVRIINNAQVPGRASSPDAKRIAVLSALLGLILSGAGVAFLEFRDNKIRTEEQLRDALGFEFLGSLAAVGGGRISLPFGSRKAEAGTSEIDLPAILKHGVKKPLSTFAETLRAIKMAIMLKAQADPMTPTGTVIGLMSCFSGEGKTTVSANLAALLASQGHKVMLLDADLRNPGLTRALQRPVEHGLVEILLDDADWRSAVVSDRETGLDIIPVKHGRAVHTSELIGGQGMRTLLSALKQDYDYIFLDLPPLAPVIDARAGLPLIDGLVFVVKWGATNLRDAEKVLQRDPRIREKAVGAILNFFDARKAQAYGDYGASYYYSAAYRRYYHD